MAEPLWTLGEVVAAARGACLGAPERPVAGFSIDTRSLVPGEGFVAIRGPNRDGHAFVAAALDQGAACAVVDRTFPPGDEERLVRVGDTLEALNDLGRASRARAAQTIVIAVTGSAGKTGTKEALKLALQPSGSVHASAKSFNNHWGVPLSLANMPEDIRFGQQIRFPVELDDDIVFLEAGILGRRMRAVLPDVFDPQGHSLARGARF